MCQHENVSFVQTIEAFHYRNFNGLEYFCNNEYGNSIRVQVGCDDCGFEKTITHKNKENQPEWIQDRIEIMKLKDEWFFT